VIFATFCADSRHCTNDDECDGDLICKEFLHANGYPEYLCLEADDEEPEAMYAGEDEHCGYTMISPTEDGYIECMDGLVCQAIEDPTATDSYGYTTICVNDTTNYGEGAAGEW
jgi:hypothetical protein